MSRSVYPLPETAAAAGARLAKALAALTKSKLCEERETSDSLSTHRTGGDLRFGLFITAAGLAAIGIGEGSASNDEPTQLGVESAVSTTSAAPRVSKTSAVIALLEGADGATLAELIAGTGWLPHTTRAALTGLRKKGHAIEREILDKVAAAVSAAGQPVLWTLLGCQFEAASMIAGLCACLMVRIWVSLNDRSSRVWAWSVDLTVTAISMLFTAGWIVLPRPAPFYALLSGTGFGALGAGVIAIALAWVKRIEPLAALDAANPAPPDQGRLITDARAFDDRRRG